MLPIPPPFPFHRLSLVVALCLGGCFQSTYPDGASPPLGDVRSFELFGVGGRCVADEWRLDIDAQGVARLVFEEFGDPDMSGEGDDSHTVVSRNSSTVEVLRAGDEWAGLELWHVFDAGEMIAWAVERPARVAALPDLPSFRACAAFEQWSLHELEGGASHVEVVDRARWPSNERDYPLWLDVESDGQVRFRDARLSLRDDGAPSGEVRGEVVSWDGVEGIVRVRNSLGLCSTDDGELIFRFVRDEIHVMQAWYTVDSLDQDHDGDREERHLRRTRSVLTARRCPFALRR